MDRDDGIFTSNPFFPNFPVELCVGLALTADVRNALKALLSFLGSLAAITDMRKSPAVWVSVWHHSFCFCTTADFRQTC